LLQRSGEAKRGPDAITVGAEGGCPSRGKNLRISRMGAFSVAILDGRRLAKA
jgi:hypothetical protein